MHHNCEYAECSTSSTPICCRFCSDCGYPLQSAEARCPECGHCNEASCQFSKSNTENPRSWLPLWVPFTGNCRSLWFLQPHSRDRLTLRWGLIATFLLAAAGVVINLTVHRVEWHFRSDRDFQPVVTIPDTSPSRPTPPILQDANHASGVFSFGSRSAYFRFGYTSSGSRGQTSDGAPRIYWHTRGLRSRLVAPDLPFRAEHVHQRWIAPDFQTVISSLVVFAPLPLFVFLANRFLLPRVLMRLNLCHTPQSPVGAACRLTLRHGTNHLCIAVFAGLSILAIFWIVGAANPGNWLVDYPAVGRFTAQALFAATLLGSAWVAARAISADLSNRVFRNKPAAIIIAVLLNVCVSVALLAASFAFLAK